MFSLVNPVAKNNLKRASDRNNKNLTLNFFITRMTSSHKTVFFGAGSFLCVAFWSKNGYDLKAVVMTEHLN
jgi:hypothetical protein